MLFDIFSDRSQCYRYDRDLSKKLKEIGTELQSTYNCFNEATEPLLIEALIYRMKELETQYEYLLQKAKLERLCGSLVSGGVS